MTTHEEQALAWRDAARAAEDRAQAAERELAALREVLTSDAMKRVLGNARLAALGHDWCGSVADAREEIAAIDRLRALLAGTDRPRTLADAALGASEDA
jgi:hypothetical protein